MRAPILSLFLLCTLSLSLCLTPQRSFSEAENRSLQTWQAPTARTLVSGEFSRQLRDAFADQFPLRALFCRLKAQGERWLGRTENNGILFGKDGYLIPKNEYGSLTVAQSNLAALGLFSEQSALPVTVLIVPRSVDVMTSALPAIYDPARASEVISLIETLGEDAVFPLEELRQAADAGEAVWYKTDHHWTTYGAYLAYVALAPTLGYTPKELSFFQVERVSDDFLGTSDSAIGGIAEEADEILLFRYEGDTRYWRQADSGAWARGLYDADALAEKDQYRIFLGGNAGIMRIRDPDNTEKPRLLLVKDSFANALLPFLALHFDVDLVDPRYGSGEPSDLLFSEEYDQILLVQGLDTLATDPALSRFLYCEADSPS